MQKKSPLLLRITACVLAALPSAVMAWLPGTYPPAPARMPTSDFVVDNNNRNDVVAFWHAVYQASEGYEARVNWTGNYSGTNGSTAAVFVDDVERRINYFRALCGVPAKVQVNTGSTVFIESADAHKPSALTLKSEAAQASALMLIRNFDPATGTDPAMSHDPPRSLTGWSLPAWNGNAHGNLAFGIFGPGAITEYMVEEFATGSATSAWNSLVGHRRWNLFPDATDFATGDQPGSSVTRPPTNVLYIAQKPGELVADPTPGFVAFPAPGFFPAPVNSRYWSVSRAGADFDFATVRMTDASGKPVAISGITSNNNYGDPALIWEVSGAAALKSVYADNTFNVSITGIGGAGVPTSFSYTVTLINPDRITSIQSLTGAAAPVSNRTTAYAFSPPTGAESLQVGTFLKKSTPWKETAEKTPKARVIDRTAANYPLQASMVSFSGFGTVSGTRAFHLTFPTVYDKILRGVPEQSFEIDRRIVAKANAKLRFLYRRGYMTKGSTLVAEMSSDGGVVWKTLGNPIRGVSDTTYDLKVTSAAFRLPPSTQPILVRFRYFTKPGAPIYTHEAAPTSPTGIFIDEITTENCDWLEPRKTTTLPPGATSFAFNAASAGGALVKGNQWCLGLRTRLGGKWFPYGPMKTVTIAAP